ncbi:spermidine/putrescine ABC transporter substrate-binding protein PotF, partial [Gilvimarinus sp. 1_MG-2023]|nr:spermidine/putrescine ABC transporter substrate-binding protein PotF [Gilvimarinus sp. 1_MG-2023]
SVPWAWGTIGLGYNVEMIKARLGDMPADTLDLIFDPKISAKLQDCGIGILDSPAEVMSIALNYAGLDPNSESKSDLGKAEALMKANRDNY